MSLGLLIAQASVALRAAPPRMLASRRLPMRVEALLPAVALEDSAAVVPLWRAVRKCYPSDDEAIAALQLNRGLLLPWATSPQSIEGNYRVLVEKLGKTGTLDVLSKNPGVLAGSPARLRLSGASEIQSVANTAAALGSLRGPPLVVAGAALCALVLASGSSDAAAAVARPTVGALGAASFGSTALLAVYVSSRKPS